MWEGLVRAPRGRLSTRNLIVLLTTCLVAAFAQLTVLITPAHAADAFWKDGSIIYADNTYTKSIAKKDDGLGLADGQAYYLYTEPIPGTTASKAFVIYFSSGTSPPETATEGTYKTFVTSNGTYTQGSAGKTLTIEPSKAGDSGEPLKEGELNSCSIQGGLGWIICPVSRWIANTMDYVYDVISDFLKVQPLQSTQTGTLYAAWDIARNIANISFIIGFLVIIYAQITGGMLTNYTIKKLMPRVIIVAILINISYWICAVAVDLSNILGYSVQDMFTSIRDSITTTPMEPITWTNVTEILLTGGTATVAGIAGYAAFITATGGTIASAIYLLLMVMVSVIFAALVALVILAMRQALITVLIITAPLAFVLYLLPNTEKWFEKWREGFATMMFMFPIFSVIFGGSQLAGTVIIQNAKSPAVAILGLAVQVAPLVVTPMIVKFSGSLLGRLAGMVNNSRKGLFDRTKNSLKDRADYHAARGRSNAADRIEKYGKRKRDMFRPTTAAYRHARAKQKREDWKKNYEERTAQLIHADEKYQRGRRESYNPKSEEFGKRQELDTYKRTTDAMHKKIEAHHEKHWNERMEIGNKSFDQETFDREVETRKLTDQAELAKNRMETAYVEIKAGKDPFAERGLAASNQRALQNQIDAIQTTAKQISVEALRKQNAEVKIQENLAKDLKEGTLTISRTGSDGKPIVIQTNIRDYAGGIDGISGANRVYAKTTADIVSAFLEDRKNSRSVLSEYNIEQLIKLHQHGVDKDGNDVSKNEALVDAAMQEILLSKGNNWSVQKTIDYIAEKRGMSYDDTTDTYKDSQGNVITDKDEISRRRDEQQLLVDAIKQSKLKVANLSGTDRGNLEAGLFNMASSGPKGRIVRDIRDKKISAERIAGTDIDELMHMVQVLRDPQARHALTADQRQSLMEQIHLAQTDERIKTMSGPREKEMMTVISKYLDPANEGGNYEAIEFETQTAIPTDYKTDEFLRGPAAYVDNGYRYGPNGSTNKR